MKKAKIMKTNVLRILDKAGISYRDYEFPWSADHLDAESAAKAVGFPASDVYKTIVTIGNKTGPLVAIIPANQTIDLKKLAKISGNKKIELLPLPMLEATTGYIRGGCSPIGMKKLLPSYLDDSAQTKAEICVSAGKRGHQVALAPSDLLPIIHGRYAAITLVDSFH